MTSPMGDPGAGAVIARGSGYTMNKDDAGQIPSVGRRHKMDGAKKRLSMSIHRKRVRSTMIACFRQTRQFSCTEQNGYDPTICTKEQKIMAGKSGILRMEGKVTPEEAGTLIDTQCRCTDENESGAEVPEISQGAAERLQVGDCMEGMYDYDCEIDLDNGKAETVRTAVTRVSVTKSIPASKAIDKLKKMKQEEKV